VSEIYDAVIVGTGAGGSTMALQLSTGGMKVMSLEYGPEVRPSQLMSMEMFNQAFHRVPYPELKPWLSGRPEPNWNNGKYFVTKQESNYTTVGEEWRWRRYRLIGGRTKFWNCVSPRFSPRDFTAALEDGYGEPWPITYKDIEPYYDRIETMAGFCGGDVDHPECPKGKYMPAAPFRCGERVAYDAIKRTGNPALAYLQSPMAIITRQHNGRAPCHYCGHCVDGCATASKFDGAQVFLPIAQRTGNWTVRTNSVVAEVLIDQDTGKARGVRYIDRVTKQEGEALAKVVVLSASAFESARILLNSTSRQYPNGLANSSGQVGRNIVDQVQCSGGGFLPQLYDLESMNTDSYGGGAYMPRFNRPYQKSLGYIRGFGIQSGSGRGIASRFPGFGPSLKKAIRSRYMARIGFGTFGERLANPDTYLEIDPSGEKDVYGIPIVRIHAKTGDNEKKMFKDMQNQLRMLLEACKAEDITITQEMWPPGWAEHEVGTCRMGKNPKTSVTNAFGQTHDVKNLFVADGGLFTQSSEKSPTVTIMALSLRESDYLVDEFKRGNL
jgi:choline dehydrogenase-like flavoprotein